VGPKRPTRQWNLVGKSQLIIITYYNKRNSVSCENDSMLISLTVLFAAAPSTRLDYFAVGLTNVWASTTAPVWLNYPALCLHYPNPVPLLARVVIHCIGNGTVSARYVTLQGQGEAICLDEVEVYDKT